MTIECVIRLDFKRKATIAGFIVQAALSVIWYQSCTEVVFMVVVITRVTCSPRVSATFLFHTLRLEEPEEKARRMENGESPR